MEIPYGFDCYAFQREEIKFFESNLYRVKWARQMAPSKPSILLNSSWTDTTSGVADFIKFTRRNEDYPREQIEALGRAQRLNMSEIDKRLFCGIKIQIGIGVVTSFLRKGLQYKPPIRGRSELLPNGTWTGVMKGLTIDARAPTSYDLALGNFLAWDEEFPYIKFGPFFAVESKLVLLTGGSRSIETSSFGTNMAREIWFTILSLLLVLSLLASLHVHGLRQVNNRRPQVSNMQSLERPHSMLSLFGHFIFIYITMLLNKPSVEFDDLIWPKSPASFESDVASGPKTSTPLPHRSKTSGQKRGLPTSIRALSYIWSATCLVLASIYSGEMLAVILLHADQNIDNIVQLINSRPQIEPVIRQDDMTHNLMSKSLDENMLRLYNITRVIPRNQVYTRSFIESISQRKVALLGDDELIDTIYDLYHKYYPIYKSRISYLQYPISFIYRKDLNTTLETQLRGGVTQMFEMGLIHRWYQAQKDTYIQFYDTYERNKTAVSKSEHKYKPLSMHQFGSLFRAILVFKLIALLVLGLEMLHHRTKNFIQVAHKK